jgi:hypothetical protein
MVIAVFHGITTRYEWNVDGIFHGNIDRNYWDMSWDLMEYLINRI